MMFDAGDVVEIWQPIGYKQRKFGVVVTINEGLDEPYRVVDIRGFDRGTFVYSEDDLYAAAMTFGGLCADIPR